jgi:hypothetical protein
MKTKAGGGIRSRGPRGLLAAALVAMLASGSYAPARAGDAASAPESAAESAERGAPAPFVVVSPHGSGFAVVAPAPVVAATARDFLNTDAMSDFARDALVARELDAFFSAPAPSSRHPRCGEALGQYPIQAIRRAFREHLKRLWFTELTSTGTEPAAAGESATPLFHRWLERWCDKTPRRNA